RYLECAWPGVVSLDDLDERVTLNVAKCYRQSMSNLVIYLQSCADTSHFSKHFSLFVQSAMTRPNLVILECGYWGIPGHGPVPVAVYAEWLEAVMAAESLEKQAILDAVHILRSAKAQQLHPTAPAKGDTRAHSEVDLRFA